VSVRVSLGSPARFVNFHSAPVVSQMSAEKRFVFSASAFAIRYCHDTFAVVTVRKCGDIHHSYTLLVKVADDARRMLTKRAILRKLILRFPSSVQTTRLIVLLRRLN
jgi:hypothetical protein